MKGVGSCVGKTRNADVDSSSVMLRCSRVRSVSWAMATPLLRKLFTSGCRVQRCANSRRWNPRATRAKSECGIVLVDVAGDERRGGDDRAGLAACRPPTLWAPGSLDSGADRARRVNTGAVVAWPVSTPSRFSCPTPPKSRLTTAPSTPMTGTSLPSTGTRSCAVLISSLPRIPRGCWTSRWWSIAPRTRSSSPTTSVRTAVSPSVPAPVTAGPWHAPTTGSGSAGQGPAYRFRPTRGSRSSGACTCTPTRSSSATGSSGHACDPATSTCRRCRTGMTRHFNGSRARPSTLRRSRDASSKDSSTWPTSRSCTKTRSAMPTTPRCPTTTSVHTAWVHRGLLEHPHQLQPC